MPVSGGGFEQAYNAQAAVDAETMLVVATGLTKPQRQGTGQTDAGDPGGPNPATGQGHRPDRRHRLCSETNIKACETAGIAPLIAVAKADHHPDWRERHSEPPALPENAAPFRRWRIV